MMVKPITVKNLKNRKFLISPFEFFEWAYFFIKKALNVKMIKHLNNILLKWEQIKQSVGSDKKLSLEIA